jgi:hypothetical protein
MNYSREDNPSQKEWFDGWTQWARNQQNNRQLVMGLGAYLNSPTATQDQVQRVRTAVNPSGRVVGVSLYSYAVSNRTQTNDDAGVETASSQLMTAMGVADASLGRSSLFSRPAPIPIMPWKSDSDRGHLMISLGRDFDGARIKVSGPESRSQVADGNGFAGFVDLRDGKYDVLIEHPNLGGSKQITGEVDGRDVWRID